MQITLNQNEINQAIEAFVRTQINIADNQSIAIDFNAGRAPNGPTATIEIKAATPEVPTSTKTTKAAPASKDPEPEAEPEVKAEPETSSDESEENVPETDNTPADEAPAEGEAPRRGSLFAKASKAA